MIISCQPMKYRKGLAVSILGKLKTFKMSWVDSLLWKSTSIYHSNLHVAKLSFSLVLALSCRIREIEKLILMRECFSVIIIPLPLNRQRSFLQFLKNKEDWMIQLDGLITLRFLFFPSGSYFI